MKRLLLAAVLLGLALVVSSSASAQNCSSSPVANMQASAAAWQSYAKWCSDCGGKPNPNNMSCTPGPNWGRTGSQASSAVSSAASNAAYQAGYQLGQSVGKFIFGDPQDKVRAAQDQQNVMQSLDQISRQQAAEQDQLLQYMAQQARQLDDHNRQDTLSALAGIPQTDALVLKPSTDFFGVPGNPKGDLSSPVDPSVVDLRRFDPDKPITVDPNALQDKGPNSSGSADLHDAVADPNTLQQKSSNQQKQSAAKAMDCVQGKTTRDRFAAGLPVQQEAIRRTEAQLEAARKGVEEAKAESKAVLLKGALDEVKAYAEEVLTSADALRGEIETLKGLDKTKRDLLIRTVNTIAFGGEDLYHSASAGYKAGPELQMKLNKLSRQIASLTMESGMVEKTGEKLSGKLWGPLGELGFRGAKLSIDLSVALGSGMVSKADQQAAQRNLDTMRDQYKLAKEHISELDSDLNKLCSDKLRARQ